MALISPELSSDVWTNYGSCYDGGKYFPLELSRTNVPLYRHPPAHPSVNSVTHASIHEHIQHYGAITFEFSIDINI